VGVDGGKMPRTSFMMSMMALNPASSDLASCTNVEPIGIRPAAIASAFSGWCAACIALATFAMCSSVPSFWSAGAGS
jgi:hypothetical protein